LWPKRALQSALADATQAVVLASKGRAIPAGNLHITLAFLGSVPVEDIGQLEGVACRVAEELRGKVAQIALDAVEYWKKAQLLCATSRGEGLDSGAVLVANTLKSRLVAAGFTPDLKPFRPHVSLARNVVRVARVTEMKPVEWAFTDFALIGSKTLPEGAAYNVLSRFSFLASNAELPTQISGNTGE
jgi:RNA 2',3'-cyclic 3'-phosphodiesterase